MPRLNSDQVIVDPLITPPLEMSEMLVKPLGTGSVTSTPVATELPSLSAVIVNSTVSPTTTTALSTSLERAISIIPFKPASKSVLTSPLDSEKISDIPMTGSRSLSLVPLP